MTPFLVTATEFLAVLSFYLPMLLTLYIFSLRLLTTWSIQFLMLWNRLKGELQRLIKPSMRFLKMWNATRNEGGALRMTIILFPWIHGRGNFLKHTTTFLKGVSVIVVCLMERDRRINPKAPHLEREQGDNIRSYTSRSKNSNGILSSRGLFWLHHCSWYVKIKNLLAAHFSRNKAIFWWCFISRANNLGQTSWFSNSEMYKDHSTETTTIDRNSLKLLLRSP